MGRLSLEHISYRESLHDVSLTVESGDIAAVRVGKRIDRAALLQIAAGVLRPTAGRVRTHGRLVYAQRAWPSLGGITVLDQLILPLLADGKTVAEGRMIAMGALADWKLEEWAGLRLADLEEHELARLSLIRAALSNPGILLVDDPTAGFGDAMAAQIRPTLKRAANSGAAVLIATSEIAAMVGAREIYSLNAGTIRGARKPAEIVDFPVEKVG